MKNSKKDIILKEKEFAIFDKKVEEDKMNFAVLNQAKEAKIRENKYLKKESDDKTNRIIELDKLLADKNQSIISVENRLELLKKEEILNRDKIINAEEENKQIEYKQHYQYKWALEIQNELDIKQKLLEESDQKLLTINEELDYTTNQRDLQIKVNSRAREEIAVIIDEYDKNVN